ncbi:MAG: nucleotide exchange factor GrpE [Erysipelotrichaceae bacterium]|nr:nucleotide exchange factor GrpE [Erysipelotrichaceae bacterium]
MSKNKNRKEVKEETKEEIPEEVEEVKEETEAEAEAVEKTDPKDEEIADLKKEVERLKNAYAKAYADTENLKKRLEQEAANTRKYRIQSFATEMLPVIDNLERALDAAEDKEEGFYKGVRMIYDQLLASLKKEGVEEIDCLGKQFDPNFQQSIMMEKKEGEKPGIVLEVLQKGYMLKDRVLRAAMVKISE